MLSFHDQHFDFSILIYFIDGLYHRRYVILKKKQTNDDNKTKHILKFNFDYINFSSDGYSLVVDRLVFSEISDEQK